MSRQRLKATRAKRDFLVDWWNLLKFRKRGKKERWRMYHNRLEQAGLRP